MLDAVVFDWGDTLMRWSWDPALLDEGHRAGVAAIGREALPEAAAITERFRETYLPMLYAPGVIEEIEYPGLVRRLFAEFDVALTEEELARFLEAEHAAWAPARELASTTHALLDALHARGLKLGLVSNALDPPWLLHRDLAELDVAQRLDVAVFSSEVGMRKPHRAIFERALERLDVVPERTLMVGDRLYEDVGGASALGMRTVQAVWFYADDNPDGGEPDFQAFTHMDVLNIVDRLRAAN